jgi:hypothetical protein
MSLLKRQEIMISSFRGNQNHTGDADEHVTVLPSKIFWRGMYFIKIYISKQTVSSHNFAQHNCVKTRHQCKKTHSPQRLIN